MVGQDAFLEPLERLGVVDRRYSIPRWNRRMRWMDEEDVDAPRRLPSAGRGLGGAERPGLGPGVVGPRGGAGFLREAALVA
jgi:hypothetical protein